METPLVPWPHSSFTAPKTNRDKALGIPIPGLSRNVATNWRKGKASKG